MRVPRQALRDTISVENYTGSGSRGAVYGAARNVRASIQPSHQLAVSADGRTITGPLNVIVRPEEEIPVESRVTWKGQKYRVIQSVAMPDDRRPTHLELVLGRLP